MAHRSKKKHLKHVHEQEPATPPAKSPVAKAEAARARIAKPTARKRGAATTARKRTTGTRMKRGTERLRAREADMKARAADTVRTAKPELREPSKRGIVHRLAGKATMPEPREPSKRGIVRRLAGKATETLSNTLPITPRKVLSRAKARMKARVSRVKALLGTEA